MLAFDLTWLVLYHTVRSIQHGFRRSARGSLLSKIMALWDAFFVATLLEANICLTWGSHAGCF